MNLKLTTDQKFALSDVNYLFECMGLTQTTKTELRQMFPSKIIDFLDSEQIVQVVSRETQRPKIDDMINAQSIDSSKNSNGPKDDSDYNLLRKDERLNSITNSTAKNSDPFT